MNIVGEYNTDIMLDENGQPVPDDSGDFRVVSGDECWHQDLRLEAKTEEGELFYEDEDGDESYGFGMLDFVHAEDDDDGMTRMEILQRVSGKLAKREYLDQGKTIQNLGFHDGLVTDEVTVSKQNSDDEYNIELSTDEVEVVSE